MSRAAPKRPLAITKARGLALAMLVFGAAGLVLLSTAVRDAVDLDWSVASLRQLVDSAGWWAPALYVGILVFRFAVLIPSSILLTGAGVCFGAAYGTLWATLGLTMSAMLKWLIVSVAGRDILLQRLPPHWQRRIRSGNQRIGPVALGLICAYPLGPKHVFQIAAILSDMTLPRYAIAVTAGSAVRAALFSFFGDTVASGHGVAAASAALLVASALPLALPRSRRWLLAASAQSN